MRRISLIGLLLVAGCNGVVTEGQARAVCEAANATDSAIDSAISLAEGDKQDGLSAGESKDLFRGDCEDFCADEVNEAECLSDCTTCANAVVNYVYSQE